MELGVEIEPRVSCWVRLNALRLRVFIDRSVGVSFRAQGQDAVLEKRDGWDMKSIWP